MRGAQIRSNHIHLGSDWITIKFVIKENHYISVNVRYFVLNSFTADNKKQKKDEMRCCRLGAVAGKKGNSCNLTEALSLKQGKRMKVLKVCKSFESKFNECCQRSTNRKNRKQQRKNKKDKKKANKEQRKQQKVEKRKQKQEERKQKKQERKQKKENRKQKKSERKSG